MRKCMVPFMALCAAAAYTQDPKDRAQPGELNDRILEELRLLRAEVADLRKKHKGRFRWDKDRRKFLAESP